VAGTLSEWAQDELAGVLGRQLSVIPERRVAELTATPLRRPFLDALFWGLPRVLGRSHAERTATSVRFRVTSVHGDAPDEYVLRYRPRRWRCTRDPEAATELTITASAPDLLALACGRAAPMRLYAAGRLRVRGNPRVAVRLLAIMRAELAPAASADPV
jgi:predicted lipid carrier protein YhbT